MFLLQVYFTLELMPFVENSNPMEPKIFKIKHTGKSRMDQTNQYLYNFKIKTQTHARSRQEFKAK